MGDVINKSTKQYLKSVHTPNYNASEWIINPVLPNCLQKYWKISGNSVVEMNASEKAAVDQAIADAIATAQDNAKDIDNLEKLTRAFALTVLDEINILRTEASLAERTVTQLRTAVKAKYDTL